uniref:Uncharacterized protein n=1 Tax=viral metagenome TaxID=1070528 RepID=A0A6M3LML9_9ZZZZ
MIELQLSVNGENWGKQKFFDFKQASEVFSCLNDNRDIQYDLWSKMDDYLDRIETIELEDLGLPLEAQS